MRFMAGWVSKPRVTPWGAFFGQFHLVYTYCRLFTKKVYFRKKIGVIFFFPQGRASQSWPVLFAFSPKSLDWRENEYVYSADTRTNSQHGDKNNPEISEIGDSTHTMVERFGGYEYSRSEA